MRAGPAPGVRARACCCYKVRLYMHLARGREAEGRRGTQPQRGQTALHFWQQQNSALRPKQALACTRWPCTLQSRATVRHGASLVHYHLMVRAAPASPDSGLLSWRAQQPLILERRGYSEIPGLNALFMLMCIFFWYFFGHSEAIKKTPYDKPPNGWAPRSRSSARALD